MTLEVNGKILETDEEGFLLDPSLWDRAIAERIALDEALDMTSQHWEVVNYVRNYFEEHHSVPEARVLLKAMETMMGKDRATRKYLYQLFPYGYGQQACKIAGMTKPRKLMLDV